MSENYIAYCDGSYQPKIETGGWSSIIMKDGKIIKKLYYGLKHTTNNRMELLAVINTLKYFKEKVNITIYSDSQYVVNSIMQGWVKTWFENEDYNKKNIDLWFELVNLLEIHNVTLIWVKGHDDNTMNNYADKLAQHAAKCLNLPEDRVTTTII